MLSTAAHEFAIKTLTSTLGASLKKIAAQLGLKEEEREDEGEEDGEDGEDEEGEEEEED